MKPSYEELEQMLEESQREFRSADITMQNLEAKCERLAAENAGMKAIIEAVQGVANQSHGIAGWHLNGAVAEWDEILPEINNAETPATDAFLNEVRASGVEMLLDVYRSRWISPHVEDADRFAAQLRKGGAA